MAGLGGFLHAGFALHALGRERKVGEMEEMEEMPLCPNRKQVSSNCSGFAP